jgi:hypothetical protein
MKDPTCEDRVEDSMAEAVADIRTLWALYQSGDEEGHEELGDIYEYGLCFDYIAPLTWDDQFRGYWRWQLSTGGPGTEFRFYASGPEDPLYSCEYWHLDWGQGASREAQGEDLALMRELWQWFMTGGSTVDRWNAARVVDGGYQWE